jgi:hypothetical protein
MHPPADSEWRRRLQLSRPGSHGHGPATWTPRARRLSPGYYISKVPGWIYEIMNWMLFYLHYMHYAYFVYYHFFTRNNTLELATWPARLFLDTRRRPASDTFGSITYFTYYVDISIISIITSIWEDERIIVILVCHETRWWERGFLYCNLGLAVSTVLILLADLDSRPHGGIKH